jgi:GNAT superfamily N-acetyltransferase
MKRMIEELSLNAWPALQTYMYDGWLLRFANGYTKRSNSICAMYEGTIEDIESKIDYCERMYEKRGLSPIFKITPFGSCADLDRLLERRGYRVADPTSVRVLDERSQLKRAEHVELSIELELSEHWIATVAEFANISEQHLATAWKLLSQPGLTKGYFILCQDSIPVSCGLGVIENGYVGLYDIVTHEDARNRGYAEQLILHILSWARENHADKGYLLVVQDNAPATRLYDKLGYEEIYTYHYRIR